MKVTVRNQFNAPKGKKQDVHQEIYEYDYIDRKTGEVKHNKINMQERIQSNLEKVNYKKQIEMGELELNANRIGSGVRDFTSVPGNKVDFIDFIAKIGSMDPKQIDNLVKQVAQKGEIKPNQDTKEDRKTDDTTSQTQSDNGGSDSKTIQGGEQ